MADRNRSRRPASAARLIGDDLQHLVSLTRALESLWPHSQIVEVELEDRDAGNLDDVVVRFRDGRCDYHQVKGTVDSTRPLTLDWLTEPTRTGGPSILQRFHDHWRDVRDTSSRLSLITSRPISQDDPVMRLLDQTETLHDVLAAAPADSDVGRRREDLRSHLDVPADELLEFMGDLTIKPAGALRTWTDRAKILLAAAGFDDTPDAVAAAVGWIRERIERGHTRLGPDDINEALVDLGLRRRPPAATLVINEIDRHPHPGNEFAVVDWVDHFPGSEPARRRLPDRPQRWGQHLDELKTVVDQFRAEGSRHVLVHGAARLPTWFATGTRLPDVAGFHVSCHQRDQIWTSYHTKDGLDVHVTPAVDQAHELAVAVAIATDPTPDVDAFLGTSDIAAERITISVGAGPDPHSLDTDTATATARAVRDRLRDLARDLTTDRIHLFLAVPHGFALLLGHLWDRLPPTVVYADAGVGASYHPAYNIG